MIVCRMNSVTRLEPGLGWLTGIGAAIIAVAAALGFGIAPLTQLGARLIEATPFPTPGLLELISGLSLRWTMPLLGALGVAVAIMVASAMMSECARITVADDHLEHRDEHTEGYLSRDRIGGVFLDRDELVITDVRAGPLVRLKADLLPKQRVGQAFVDHGYPWLGNADPHELDYHRWLDGHPGLTSPQHALLRQRRQMLQVKDHNGAASAARKLASAGVAVRDRGVQQVRRLAQPSITREEDYGADG